ncbi:MAG: hypothetical protein WCD86_16970 [Ktedonobacteraceae bacterium]
MGFLSQWFDKPGPKEEPELTTELGAEPEWQPPLSHAEAAHEWFMSRTAIVNGKAVTMAEWIEWMKGQG